MCLFHVDSDLDDDLRLTLQTICFVGPGRLYVGYLMRFSRINAKTCKFKTRCSGDISTIENNTDRFCEDARENALAVLRTCVL